MSGEPVERRASAAAPVEGPAGTVLRGTQTSPAHGPGDRSAQFTRTPAGRRDRRGERRMVPKAEPRSYYGHPVVKEPVWKPEVPLYLFSGGLAGASAGLAFGASLTGDRQLERCAWGLSLAGAAASPVLLIADLGRPERFYNMLRVFKVTSPMNVGSWLLSAAGGAIGLAAAHELLGRFPRSGRAAKPLAAVLGMPLSTYTAVLLSNTAIPVWHAARCELPFVFAGSSMASAGAAAALLTPRPSGAPARRLAVVGTALEAAATLVMEWRLGELGEPYHQGSAGRLSKLAKGLGWGGGLALGVARARNRPALVAGSLAALAGAVLERWAVFRAGFQSAQDPKYTVGPQRQRAEERGTRATTPALERSHGSRRARSRA